MKNTSNEFITILCKNIVDNYKDWEFDFWDLTNTKTGIHIKRSDHRINTPFVYEFTYWQWRKVNSSIKQCQELQLIDLIKN